MRIRSNKLCVDTYGASDYKSAITICAGGLGTSMCYGDSGGKFKVLILTLLDAFRVLSRFMDVFLMYVFM